MPLVRVLTLLPKVLRQRAPRDATPL